MNNLSLNFGLIIDKGFLIQRYLLKNVNVTVYPSKILVNVYLQMLIRVFVLVKYRLDGT